MSEKRTFFKELGPGLCLRYQEVPNGYGGYRTVNMTLFWGILPVRRLTNRRGRILKFPGIVRGPWEKNLTKPLRPQVNFTAGITPFQNGFLLFSWMVQPDGFYYADEDGFGAENDIEITLYAFINPAGRFITPFSDTPPALPGAPAP